MEGIFRVLRLRRGAAIALAVLIMTGLSAATARAEGDGTFGAKTDFAAGDFPFSVALADVNGDGALDAVTANVGSNNISVLLGGGMGGFGADEGPFAVGDSPASVALADVNADGALDAVTANANSDDISVLLGDGMGGFVEALNSPFAAGDLPASVALADLNADGALDAVTANQVSDNISVLLGDGMGGFAAVAGSPFDAGNFPGSVALADVNADGALDAVTANLFSNNISVLLGDGGGGFAAAVGSPFAAGDGPFSVALADVNADGALDAVTTNNNSDDISVLLGDGGGGFAAAVGSPFDAGDFPTSVALVDVNADGALDAVTANNNSDDISVLLGNSVPGPSSFVEALNSPFDVGGFPDSVVLADVNTDGALDAVTANQRSNNISVVLGDGGGGFVQALNSPFDVGDFPASVALGDVNADGALDAVTANRFSGDISLLLGDGAGGFGDPTDFTAGLAPGSVALADVNADGALDAVAANESSDNISVLLGDGMGSFVEALNSPFDVGGFPDSVALADVNGDGALDAVTANFDSNNISVLLGDGGGSFVEALNSPFDAGDLPTSVALADVNGDGALDAVIAIENSDAISVLLGNGGGSFVQALNSPFAAGDGPLSVALADVNADGALDAVTANFSSDNISVLLGGGEGGFGDKTDFDVGDRPLSVALADVNADGALDAVTANTDSGDISVLLGTYNQAPTANAGSDADVECVDQLGSTTIQLDGSGSSDPDGDALTYDWTTTHGSFDDDTLEQPTLDVTGVAVGTVITVSLTVNDGTVDSASDDDAEITVVDTTDPVPTCPADIEVEPTGPGGAVVNFAVPAASDDCDPNPTESAAPASGSLFPIGTTVVTVTATDASGNSAQCSFDVKVLSVDELLAKLMNDVQQLLDEGAINKGVGGALLKILRNVEKSLDRNDIGAACDQLQDFIDTTNSRIDSNKLDPADGQPLIDSANNLRATLGC